MEGGAFFLGGGGGGGRNRFINDIISMQVMLVHYLNSYFKEMSIPPNGDVPIPILSLL